MSDNRGNWCTIESDPGVFTSLLEAFGVQNVELSELWSLDDDSLLNIVHGFGKVYGLIFLFKWKNTTLKEDNCANTRKPLVGEEAPPDLFFAKQVTHNACATQAILSVIFNAHHVSDDKDDKSALVLGPTLTAFKTVTSSFPPDLKGEAIGASEDILEVHNSFSRKDTFMFLESKRRFATDDDDVFHFIAYVPHSDENVYELDGLQPGPIEIGTFTESGEDASNTSDMKWLSVARSAIQDRIEKYAATEIKFNLMAVVKDKRIDIRSKLDAMIAAGMKVGVDENETATLLRAELVAEDDKRRQWSEENERRKHNYLPFVMELIKALAESGKLPHLIQKANEQTTEQRRKVKAVRLTKEASVRG